MISKKMMATNRQEETVVLIALWPLKERCESIMAASLRYYHLVLLVVMAVEYVIGQSSINHVSFTRGEKGTDVKKKCVDGGEVKTG